MRMRLNGFIVLLTLKLYLIQYFFISFSEWEIIIQIESFFAKICLINVKTTKGKGFSLKHICTNDIQIDVVIFLFLDLK